MNVAFSMTTTTSDIDIQPPSKVDQLAFGPEEMKPTNVCN